jgi:hypothetical protein
VAPNVVPPAAQAELMFRTVSDAAMVMEILRSSSRECRSRPILEVPPRADGDLFPASTRPCSPTRPTFPFPCLGAAAAVRPGVDSRGAHVR